MTAAIAWDQEFKKNLEAHQKQNADITADFFKKLRVGSIMERCTRFARSILEVGCGTGELLEELAKRGQRKDGKRQRCVGLDLSPEAIVACRGREGRLGLYDVWNCTGPIKDRFGQFDLAVTSNTLEHFRDYKAVLDRMFECSHRVLAIVPFEQDQLDEYRQEGDEGHVTRFSWVSFNGYDQLDSLVFKTGGWQCGENPRQLAILLEKPEEDEK